MALGQSSVRPRNVGTGFGVYVGPRPTGPVSAARTPASAPRDTEYVSRGISLPEDLRRTPVRGGTPPPVPDNIEAPPPSRGTPQPLDFRDSSYNAQIAALDRALRDFETGASTRGQRYQEDFSTGLGRMGFRPAPQPMAMSALSEGAETPNTFGMSTGPLQGSFDIEGEVDRTSAAARGTRGMRDEFAGRGTLRSSDFAKSFGDFQNRLNQQLQGMETGRNRFTEDLQTELAQFQARTGEQRASAQEAAQNRALMRQLSQMGF
jgi:hypothetical protein